jgi:hypothetical protein
MRRGRKRNIKRRQMIRGNRTVKQENSSIKERENDGEEEVEGRKMSNKERWNKMGRMKRTTWRKLKESKGMKEENKMENTNFKKPGREGEDEKKKRKTRKRGEEMGKDRKRNQKLKERRGKEAKENEGQGRCNTTKSLFLYVGFKYTMTLV